MGYDEQLAAAVRDVLADRDDVTERNMFGGLAFLVAGSMAVAASGQGGLMVRVDPEHEAELLERPGVEPVEMRQRVMHGWVRVRGAHLTDPFHLADWVGRGVDCARRS